MNKAFHVISGVTNIPDSLHLPIPLSIDRFAPAFFATYHPVHFGFVFLVPQQYLLHLSLPRRSEEHTSELQSRGHLVCRLLLATKKARERTPTCVASSCIL